MKKFDFILYDPKKFIVSGVTVIAVIPVLLIGLLSFTAGANNAHQGRPTECVDECDKVPNNKNRDNNVNSRSEEPNQPTADKKDYNSVNRNSDESNGADRENKQHTDKDNIQSSNRQAQSHNKEDCKCDTHQASVSKKSDMDDSKDKKQHTQKTRVVHHHRTVVHHHHTTSKVVKPTQTQQAPAHPDTTVKQAQPTQPTQVVVHVQQPAPQVAAATTPAQPRSDSSTKALPNTGPDDVFKIAGITGVVAGLGHWLYNRRRVEY